MENIITFCSFCVFLWYKWAKSQTSRGHSFGYYQIFKSPSLRASCWWKNFGRSSFQTFVIPALIYTLSAPFLTLGLFLSATPKRWEKKSIRFPNDEFYAEYFDKKKFIKKIKYSRRSPDSENSRCDHQQPYNFFSIFADFRIFSDYSGKPKLVCSKGENLAVTGEKEKFLEPIEKNPLFANKFRYFVLLLNFWLIHFLEDVLNNTVFLLCYFYPPCFRFRLTSFVLQKNSGILKSSNSSRKVKGRFYKKKL